ncbi:lytic transglycosylase domain-containing protein [Novosphingobium sp. Rr 2-17]|uniref:lytic transglycosylase domain-containing protein n=1 Tax=Novosphingobium sp. Rr 2-17 TaxID=555793 RepID=UPI001ED90827|nr:lytic transglycosylase domain-containing protein [Novosphingobium sp. Rr 2-17]
MITNRAVLRLVLFSTLCVGSIENAQARSALSSAHEVRLGQCIREAAAGRTWLERTLWGLRDQEAGWIGAEVLNANGTHDLGPLQINSSWVPKLAALVDRQAGLVRAWLIDDPCFNVQAARWIFLSGLNATGNYWRAVGIYHSPTAWRQRRYALAVAGHLRRRFGPNAFRAEQPGPLEHRF